MCQRKTEMRLTAATIRNLVLPSGKVDYIFFDSDLPGFGLRVRSTGGKTWMVQYAVHGRTRRMALGTPAMLDPGKAREAAKDLLAKARLGQDPAGAKAELRAAAAMTFGSILPRYLERQRARLKPRSLLEVDRHLSSHLRTFHYRPIESIDRRSIAIRLAEIGEASGPAAANRVRASLSAFLTWCAKEGLTETNACTFTNKAPENGARERVLSDSELAAIWTAADTGEYGAIIRLLMLLGCRRAEVGDLRRSEVDLEAGTITLAPARTKNKREHVIPLSPAAIEILAAQPHRFNVDGSPRDLIFGCSVGFMEWSRAKADLDARITAAGKPFEWRVHDFRRSLSTSLHERFGVQPNVVEVILGHVGGHKGGVAGVYNKALYLPERRRALTRWAEHLDSVVTGKPVSATIVNLR
jgi:integrase